MRIWGYEDMKRSTGQVRGPPSPSPRGLAEGHNFKKNYCKCMSRNVNKYLFIIKCKSSI